MQWLKSSSTERPAEIDETSSEVYVYLRRNIEETEKESEEGTIPWFEYEEAKISKADYYDISAVLDKTASQTEQNTADIDYIMIMEDL